MIEKAIKAGVPELEEVQVPTASQKAQKILLELSKYFTRGKIIVFSTVLLILFVAYLGLILFSQQKTEDKNVSSALPVESPLQPENQPAETELEKSIKDFARRTSSREDYKKTLSFPTVDLNLDF